MQSRISTAIVFLGLFLAGAALVSAGQPANTDLNAGRHWVALMNHKGDSDTTISKEEFDHYLNEQFDKADEDHDGTLDAAELGKLRASLMAK